MGLHRTQPALGALQVPPAALEVVSELSTLAHPNQILLTEAVRIELATLQQRLGHLDLGEHVLSSHGGEPQRVAQLTAPGRTSY